MNPGQTLLVLIWVVAAAVVATIIGNRKGRPKKRQHYRLSDAVAAKLDQEIRVNGGRGESKLSTLRLLLRRIVEKAATGDMRGREGFQRIEIVSETIIRCLAQRLTRAQCSEFVSLSTVGE